MALTDDEAHMAFRAIADMLREMGLDWVVMQVEEKLALGKVQTKKLRSARETPEAYDGYWEATEIRSTSAKQKSGALFAVAEQYDASERLDTLLDSVIFAVPIASDVAQETFANLGTLGIEGILEFAPEAEVRQAYTLQLTELNERADACARLLTLIHELRGGQQSADPARSTH